MDIIKTSISFLLNRLHTNEHVGAHDDMLLMIKEDVENIPEAANEAEEYRKAVGHLQLVFRHSAKSVETMHISELNKRREILWRACRRLIKVYLGNADTTVCQAAHRLLVLMNKYGNVPDDSLYGETGSLRHTMEDFDEAEAKAEVALIPGLSALIDELGEVNTELGRLYFKRLNEAEIVKELGKLADHLPHADKCLIALFRALNIVYGYNERTANDPAVKETIERIAVNADALLSQLKIILAHRGIKIN
ncbi:hypothetical protein FACS1894181_11220 [Bacteroidia bacterium]|nr:hypothetical protein FACS1894181_11220 [Bacteroidia bacterium]